MITLKQLVTELDKTDLSFESDEQMQMVFTEYERDCYATMQIHNERFIAGTGFYCEEDNSFSYTNARCPEFDNVEDAVDWLKGW